LIKTLLSGNNCAPVCSHGHSRRSWVLHEVSGCIRNISRSCQMLLKDTLKCQLSIGPTSFRLNESLLDEVAPWKTVTSQHESKERAGNHTAPMSAMAIIYQQQFGC
jgi:hypothetical protein